MKLKSAGWSKFSNKSPELKQESPFAINDTRTHVNKKKKFDPEAMPRFEQKSLNAFQSISFIGRGS